MANKYYWLKLKNDFFKRHDIRIIESMDNGEKYVLFYMKLLLESITHGGELRFSEFIPYDEKTLSIITNTDVDVVRSAMKVLTELGMVQIFDDSTIFMTECERMIGKDESSAERTRLYRERKAQKLLETVDSPECDVTVTSPSISISNSISNSISKSNKKKEPKKAKEFTPPTLEEVKEYAKSRGREDIAKKFFDWYEVGHWLDKDGKPICVWKQKFIAWEGRNPAPIRPASVKEFEPIEEPKDLIPEEEREKLINETRERLKGMF